MLKKFRVIAMIMVMAQMVFSGSMQVFADDNEPSEPAGRPNITIVNGPVFDVEAGKENEVDIEIKNLSSSIAHSVVAMPRFSDVDNNPFKITSKSGSTNIPAISGNASRKLTLLVDVDKTAATQTYAVEIKFSCFNSDGVNYDSSSTIYFKVKNVNSEGNMFLENFVLEPDGLEAGGTGTITATVKNRGPLNMFNVEAALTDLDPAVISAVGENGIKFQNFPAGTQQEVKFSLAAGSELAAGSYPITFSITAKDENNRSYSTTQKYYISVGGSTTGKKGVIEIRELSEPSGVFDVNQNANISFQLVNSGDAEAKNVKVSANEYGEGGNIVPKSASVISAGDIAPNGTYPVDFTFAATGASKTRNYTVEIKVEYEQNGKAVSFSQYAGMNVSNPDNDDESENKKESKPKIIVSEYKSDPLIVDAGGEFDLYMTFLNTHAQKNAKNVKMFLTMTEETSAETKTTGNIFTPVNSSNTFYFDAIPSKGTVTKQLRLFTVPDAQPKTYTLTVNFEYEDEEGTEYTATELLGINVQQTTKVETSEIVMPSMSELGMPVSLYFDIYNTGKVALSNLKVTLEGDIETSAKSMYIGNCGTGESSYYEGSFSVLNEGANNVKVIISYDDPSGKTIEKVNEYTVEGTAPMPMDDTTMNGELDNVEGEKGFSISSIATKRNIILAVVFVTAIIVAATLVKRNRRKKAEKFIEADDDIFGSDQNSMKR
ncbi:MAG: hypothetical protein HFE62_05875 [Firmicutes bacterium]|nr:hypothetical protein [Bacillota bacterium]